jgi:Cupin-like domain
MLFTGREKPRSSIFTLISTFFIFYIQSSLGEKLLFPHEEQYKLYRKPFEVLSMADFSNYYLNNGTPDYENFPALKYAKGYEVIMEYGNTLFMPAGYWHHMEYLDSGFAMSLRALQSSMRGKLNRAWNLFGMRSIDTLMKKLPRSYMV